MIRSWIKHRGKAKRKVGEEERNERRMRGWGKEGRDAERKIGYKEK